VDSAHAVRGRLLLPRSDGQPDGKRVPRGLVLPRGCRRADALSRGLVVPAAAGKFHATVSRRILLRSRFNECNVGYLPPWLLLRRVRRGAGAVRGGLLHVARQQRINSEPVRCGDFLRYVWGEFARRTMPRGVILPPRVG
jgi:hypothetical protein